MITAGYGRRPPPSGRRELEQRPGVLLVDRVAVGVGEPVDLLDEDLDVIEPTAVGGVAHRTSAGLLRAEQAAIDPDGLEQQLDRVLRVQARVEPQGAHAVDVGLAARVARDARHEPTDLVGDRAAGVGDDQLQVREVLGHSRRRAGS